MMRMLPDDDRKLGISNALSVSVGFSFIECALATGSSLVELPLKPIEVLLSRGKPPSRPTVLAMTARR